MEKESNKISRRQFVQRTALATGGMMLVPHFLHAISPTQVKAAGKGKILIVVEQGGGNDGLNMVVPYGNDEYYRVRPTISIPAKELHKLDDMQGLHPQLGGLREAWDAGEMQVLNSVGYPNTSWSHFQSAKRWARGLDVEGKVPYGWIGKYLDHYQVGKPWMAIDISNEICSEAMVGSTMTGIPFRGVEYLRDLSQNPMAQKLNHWGPGQDHPVHNHLYRTMSQSFQSAAYLEEKVQPIQRNVDYPSPNNLARELKIVADLILSGSETQVYYVVQGGYDTHSGQINPHAKLMAEFGDAIAAFRRDMKQLGRWKDITIVNFSEFGRRIAENGGRGTDHGKANMMFLMGGDLAKPGIYNESPNLTDTDYGDIKHTLDFRQVYATLIEEVLCVPSGPIVSGGFAPLGFIRKG